MLPIRCMSSQMMTKVLVWRDDEKLSLLHAHPRTKIRQTTSQDKIKLVGTELASVLIAISSLIETIAYATLFIPLTLPLCLINKNSFKHSIKLLSSSIFTIRWSINNLKVNFIYRHIPIYETNARVWLEKKWRKEDYRHQFMTLGQVLLGQTLIEGANGGNQTITDRLALAVYNSFLMTRPSSVEESKACLLAITQVLNQIKEAIEERREESETIAEGAKFYEKLLADSPPLILELFKEMDIALYIPILTKAIFMYAYGEEKHLACPDFFKTSTNEAIMQLRQQTVTEDTAFVSVLSTKLENLDCFDDEIKDESIRQRWNELRRIANGECQASLFVTYCWSKAIDEMNKASNAT